MDRINRTPSERQAVSQEDAVRDQVTQPIHEDAITRVARCIFAYRWPNAWWTDPLYKSERDDCILLAAQFQEIFREHWTMFNAAERLTVHTLELMFGPRTPGELERQAIQDYAESYLEDLGSLLMGDGRMREPFKRNGLVS